MSCSLSIRIHTSIFLCLQSREFHVLDETGQIAHTEPAEYHHRMTSDRLVSELSRHNHRVSPLAERHPNLRNLIDIRLHMY